MSNIEVIPIDNQTIGYTVNGLKVGQLIFQSISKVVWHDQAFNFTGQDTEGNTKTLSGLETDKSIEILEAQRKLFPNAAILSKCLGLAQLSMGEVAIAENNSAASAYFQESINSLERALEQEPEDSEACQNLTLSYCYVEELEETKENSEDYSELINDLLLHISPEVLSEIAKACAIRGRIYFEEGKITLGFNFLKQELFLWRHQQLLTPQNGVIWQRLEASAKNLIKRCIAQGWTGVAKQLEKQLTEWTKESSVEEDPDSLDPRLAEAAEFERAGKAYLSHKDKTSAMKCFENHTSLMKLIYQGHAPMPCYAELLIDSYIRTIDLFYETESTRIAEAFQRELIELMEALLITYPQNEFYLNSLSACCEALAERKLDNQDLAEALVLYQQSLHLNEKLILVDKERQEYQANKLGILKKLAELHAQTGK